MKSRTRPLHFAFTLIELLVVIFVLALGAVMLVPALAKTKPASQFSQCENNLKQLTAAWTMYAGDNSDKAAVMLQGGENRGGVGDPVYGAGWAQGWLDWTSASDNTNPAFLVDERYSKLAKYTGQVPGLFKCPADRYLSLNQRSLGWKQRVRSYSANVGLGPGNAEAGPWDSLYKHITKITDFLYPGPAETWVFVEEHPDSMNDPVFFSPHQTSWVDLPAAYHNGAAGLAFADGRAELHKWRASLASVRVGQVNFTGSIVVVPGIGDADVHWMSYHAPRVSTNSY